MTVPLESEQQTKQFCQRFKIQRAAFLAHVQGDIAEAERDLYGSLVLNRLMFLSFLQVAGFLDGDPHYLQSDYR